MQRMWKCEVCGFIHSGDEPPGECPVCGAGADMFSPFEAVVLPDAAREGGPRAWRCEVCGRSTTSVGPPTSCPVCSASSAHFRAVGDEAAAPALPPDIQRLVVLGAGVAGVTASEHARAAAPDVAITLISNEPGWPYYRLNLTRFLAGNVSEESLVLAGRDWMDRQRVELVSSEVVEIDRAGRSVVLREGRRIPYERLVVAAGSRPFVPPIRGATRDGVFCLRTLADAKAILERAQPGARGVCVGGGLLGLETAGALARRGLRITIFEGAPWLLPRQLAEPAGRHLERHLERLGMTTRCNVRVEEIAARENEHCVRLAGGDEVTADFVVLAAGVRPTVDLARASGLEVKSGIVVDDRLFTSDPAILAAGDVAEHAGRGYGLWSAAYAQGVVAGRNAVGGRLEFRALSPASRLKVLDVDLMSIGEIQPTGEGAAVWEVAEPDRCVRLVTRGGKLVGANILGQLSLEAAVREAVESGAEIAARPDLASKLPPEFLRSLGITS